MDLGSPVLDVAPAVRGALLQALARLEQPVTRRQLAAAAGVAPGNASAVIEDLIQSGLVEETVAGRSSMVVLNRNHLAAGPLLLLAGLRSELIRRLRERLSGWPDLRGAWLFGSVARGEADRDSDVDLLLVADDLESPDLHERLSQLQGDVRTWTGNDLQLVEHSPPSWRKLVRSKNPLVEQIRIDGIALAGDTAALLERTPMTRSKGSRKPCDALQARQRLVDARQFLEAAKLLDAPDVVATNAIHSAIAAADAITCHALGERSNDGNHVSAVDLLRKVDATLATALKRAFDRKTQAGYESTDISATDAASCVRWAEQLLAAAEARFES